MIGIKHTIECNCILPQYKNRRPPIYHQFIVFSIIDSADNLLSHYSQCNNCGIVHSITDVCKSEVLVGQEHLTAVISIEDIKLMIPSDLSSVLENYSCELANWQHAHFIYSNKKWGDKLVLVRENLEHEVRGKLLVIEGSDKFKIEPFIESLGIEI